MCSSNVIVVFDTCELHDGGGGRGIRRSSQGKLYKANMQGRVLWEHDATGIRVCGNAAGVLV